MLYLRRDVTVLNDEELIKDKLVIDKTTLEHFMLQKLSWIGTMPSGIINEMMAQLAKILEQFSRLEEARSAFAN